VRGSKKVGFVIIMNKRMSPEIWNPASISKAMMDQKIKNCTTNFLAWHHIARLVLERGIPLKELKIAEVGSGTGALSLAFALLGADVCLIDYNEKVLKSSADIYQVYGCNVKTVVADCMELPDSDLRERFDVVISCGLAEHFIGTDRERCIAYHKYLLKNNGFVCIGVPNKLSPFYQWIKSFRKMTGTWDLEIEIPYSPGELIFLASKVGLKKLYVIGNMPLKRDFIVYSLGFLSAVKDLMPTGFQKRLKVWKTVKKVGSSADLIDINRHCNSIIALVDKDLIKKPSSWLTNNFSAGIYLFAFNVK